MLNDIKKGLMYVHSEVENLNVLIDNEDLIVGKLHYWKYVSYRLFERRGSLSKKRKYN